MVPEEPFPKRACPICGWTKKASVSTAHAAPQHFCSAELAQEVDPYEEHGTGIIGRASLSVKSLRCVTRNRAL